MINICRYSIQHQELWDNFVANSNSPLPLFYRDYLEYHSHRFTDHSLLFFDQKNTLIAVCPANITEDNSLISHQGLTYGGLLLKSKNKCELVSDIVWSLKVFVLENNINCIILKNVPSNLCIKSSDDIQYFLFHQGFKLHTRELSSYIPVSSPLKLSDSRKCSARRSQKLSANYSKSLCIESFYELLLFTLSKYSKSPTHTADEINLLITRFPDKIFTRSVYINNLMVASSLIIDYGTCWHTQYLCQSVFGQKNGSLDFLILNLIEESKQLGKSLSFGISTEDKGSYLNENLYFYKQSFSSHAILNDSYIFTSSKSILLPQ